MFAPCSGWSAKTSQREVTPQGSKFPNTRYLPKTIIWIPNIETLDSSPRYPILSYFGPFGTWYTLSDQHLPGPLLPLTRDSRTGVPTVGHFPQSASRPGRSAQLYSHGTPCLEKICREQHQCRDYGSLNLLTCLQPPNVPLLLALWSLLDGIGGLLHGSWVGAGIDLLAFLQRCNVATWKVQPTAWALLMTEALLQFRGRSALQA